MNKCIIVASGQSAKDFIAPDGIDIISVNNAISRVPNAKYWFTLDPANYNLKIINDKNIKAIKYVACPDAFNLPDDVIRCKRVENHTRSRVINQDCYEYFLYQSKATLGLSLQYLHISTGNSGYGALNLAYHLGYKDIALIGIDGNNVTSLDNNSDTRGYLYLNQLFDSVQKDLGLNIVSLGELKSFPKMSLDEWLKR